MPLLLGIFQVTTDPAYSNYLPTGYPSFLTSGVTFFVASQRWVSGPW